MCIHPTLHHATLSSFLCSPTIHLVHKIISKTTAFDPRGGGLPLCRIHVINLEDIYSQQKGLSRQSVKAHSRCHLLG